MPGLFSVIPLLFAENAVGAQGPFQNTLITLLPIPLLFYLLIFRPRQLEERKRNAMLNAMKPKDKVLTAGGIYGTVVSVDKEQDRVVVRVDDDKGIKFAFGRAYIIKVVDSSPEKPADAS
ncbi:MAG: preprotein translocase subunit YajC [Planctomycetaceae bacterium]|nr:preprotein translocase subunit YajC [Planctomycetaceae bacterium]